MAKPTFETFIAEERERLQKAKKDLLSKRQEIDDELRAADRELHAIAAYEQAKQGKGSFAALRARRPRDSSGPRVPRGSRDQLKTQIVALVKQHPEGLVSDQINQSLSASDAKAKASIAAVLSLLKKDGTLHQEQRRGPYFVPPNEEAA
jgi:hypothetical protein